MLFSSLCQIVTIIYDIVTHIIFWHTLLLLINAHFGHEYAQYHVSMIVLVILVLVKYF